MHQASGNQLRAIVLITVSDKHLSAGTILAGVL